MIYKDNIPPEYLNNPPDHTFTLADFAEQVTQETMPFLLMRLANESETTDYQQRIMAMTAETLNVSQATIEREFRVIKDQNTFGPGGAASLILDLEDFLKVEFPKKQIIIAPWLREAESCLVLAKRGVGKTYFGYSLSLAVTYGLKFGWKVITPVPVMYVDAEMDGEDIQARMQMLKAGLGKPVKPLRIFSHHLAYLREAKTFSLLDEQFREVLFREVMVTGTKLLVLDNLAALCPGIDENASGVWAFLHDYIRRLRFAGVAVVVFHHLGKKEVNTGRGHSGLEDPFVTIMTLTTPPVWDPIQGCAFITRFTKARSTHGAGLQNKTFRLVTEGNVSSWQVDDAKETEKTLDRQIVVLLGNGEKPKEIVKRLNTSNAKISRVKKKAVQDGYLEEYDKGKVRFTERGQDEYDDEDPDSIG